MPKIYYTWLCQNKKRLNGESNIQIENPFHQSDEIKLTRLGQMPKSIIKSKDNHSFKNILYFQQNIMDVYRYHNEPSQYSLMDNDNISTVKDYFCDKKIHNIVATIYLKKPLVLKDIYPKLRNAEYNPKRFGALIVRIRDPKCTALIFKSGKIVLAGTKSEEEVEAAAKKYVDILSKITNINKSEEIKPHIHNMVAVGDCKFPIRLEGLSIDHISSTTYEPELFSGLIYRMENPHVVLLIFVSGKVVVTGANSQGQIDEAFKKITPVLLSCRKE